MVLLAIAPILTADTRLGLSATAQSAAMSGQRAGNFITPISGQGSSDGTSIAFDNRKLRHQQR